MNRRRFLIAGSTAAASAVIGYRLFSPTFASPSPLAQKVAASDLVPEVNTHHGIRSSLLVFAGVALFWVSEHLLAAAGLH